LSQNDDAVYIAHKADNEKFKERVAGVYRGDVQGKGTLPNCENITGRDIHCRGCMSDDLFLHYSQCDIRGCSSSRGYSGCHECDEFPCEYIDNFPMTVGKKVILRSIPYRKKFGTEKWVKDEEARYYCPECNNKVFRGVARCNKCRTEFDLD